MAGPMLSLRNRAGKMTPQTALVLLIGTTM